MKPPGGPPTTPARATRVIVLSKAPIRGFVKTRLAAVIGAEAALAVHERLASHVLAEIESAVDLRAIEGGLDVDVRVTPDDAARDARTWVPAPFSIRPQGPGDLGDRMRRAFDEAFAEGARRAILVGTDCPGFLRRHVSDAVTALARADVVIGPATDGGFWLLGACAPTPALFHDVPWSTSEACTTTRRLAREAGLRVVELEVLSDIDTVDDLERLRRDPRGHDLRL